MSTTHALTVERLDQLVEDCMPETTQAPLTEVIVSSGILNDYVFVPAKIEVHHEEIHQMLLELPEQFRQEVGGGWSFLNMALRSDGHQWTGLHSEQETLMCLGVAAGWVAVTPSRSLWAMMPGGMPFVVVLTERAKAELADAATLEQINSQIAEHMSQHHQADLDAELLTHMEAMDELAMNQMSAVISGETVTVITPACVHCGKKGQVTLPTAAYNRFLAGEFIQRAWPEGSAGDREQLINGTHDACFQAMFPEED